ncbi:MAG: helix-turn-helix transcriptional regulator [Gaiella sp.]
MTAGDGLGTRDPASEPRRARILATLRAAPAGLDVAQLATEIELHPNTIRWHLGHLTDAGLVRSSALHLGRPGRPRIVFVATTGTVAPAESYRFLAEMLASTIAAAPDGPEQAERAGRSWGRYLLERPPPGARLTADEVGERLVELLDAHGFAPRREAGTIEMHRCPFHELVDTYGDVVCGLHRGLLAGALDELDAGIGLVEFAPYPEPTFCRARLSSV